MAVEFLERLKHEKVDTIIFYKRTCIGCCDFFNIFWSVKRQRFLAKFYFDFDDMQTHAKTINLTSDKVFEMLNKNFTVLKSTMTKWNIHENKDGTPRIVTRDHDCFAEISVYTKHDSIISNRMDDHFFDKYTDFDFEFIENKRIEKLMIIT